MSKAFIGKPAPEFTAQVGYLVANNQTFTDFRRW